MNLNDNCFTEFEYGDDKEDFYNIIFDFQEYKSYKKSFSSEKFVNNNSAYLILREKNNKVQFYQTLITPINNVISFQSDYNCEKIEIVMRRVTLESTDYQLNHSSQSQLFIDAQSKSYFKGSYYFRDLPSFIVKESDFNNNIVTLLINNTNTIVFYNELYSIKINV